MKKNFQKLTVDRFLDKKSIQKEIEKKMQSEKKLKKNHSTEVLISIANCGGSNPI